MASQRTPAQLPNVAASESTRGRTSDRYRRHDWSTSLRSDAETKPSAWGKEFQPTVPHGPRLRTEERSRRGPGALERVGDEVPELLVLEELHAAGHAQQAIAVAVHDARAWHACEGAGG